MTRKDEILNYANSFKGKGVESEELKEIIRLAIIDGATWADSHPKWKPSDEQMRELSIVATGKGYFSKDILSELLEQLKKLREE